MTIIYNYNNHHYSGFKLSSSSWSQRRRTRAWKHNLLGIENHWGLVKIFIIPLSLVVVLGGYWLMLFGSNIALNYKIYQTKANIAVLEKKVNLLQEKASEMISDQELINWAQNNDFTKVKNISYLNLENSNLAQVTQDNF